MTKTLQEENGTSVNLFFPGPRQEKYIIISQNVRILCLYYKVTFSKMLNFHTLNFLIECLILVTTALSNFDRCLLRFAVHKTGVSVMKYFSYWNVIKYFFAWLWVDLFLKVHIKQTAVMFSLLQLSQIRYNLKVHYH